MRIALIADPAIPVPPKNYGGIERVIELLINNLRQNGHYIILFAHADSAVSVDEFFPFPAINQSPKAIIVNSLLVAKIIRKKIDIVHSFGRLAFLWPLLPFSMPKLMSYQREPTISQIIKALKYSAKNSIFFTGCSDYISRQIAVFAPVKTIFNATSMAKFTFRDTVDADAPLVFLGRLEEIKGAHIAIEIAEKTGRDLIIAGNIPPESAAYYDKKIAPFITQKNIYYLGEVNDEQKNRLLGAAAALLMPITWNEPFGIVMAEALACGTPVIAMAKGAANEVIINGTNGWLCRTSTEMAAAVAKIDLISRKNCRLDAENRFSGAALVNNFEALYLRLISNETD